MRLVAPLPRPGARAASGRPNVLDLGRQDAEIGTIADHVARLRDQRARAGRVVDREVGAGERDEELDGPCRGRGSQEGPQARRASELATRPGDVTAVDHQPDADGAGRDARKVAVDPGWRVDRFALRDQGRGDIPGASFDGHERAVSEHAVQDRDVARRSGSDDRVGQRGVRARPITDREAREGQLPQREVPPGASRPLRAPPLEWRSPARRRRPSRAMPARSIARPASNEAVPSGGRPSNVPRSATSANRIVAGDIARGDLLPGCQHGQPGACLERVDTQAPGPGSDRRPMAGPVKLDEAVADQRGGEVRVACREGVIDGAIDGVIRLVPRRGSPMEGGHQVGLADRELPLEEVAQERVVAV